MGKCAPPSGLMVALCILSVQPRRSRRGYSCWRTSDDISGYSRPAWEVKLLVAVRAGVCSCEQGCWASRMCWLLAGRFDHEMKG